MNNIYEIFEDRREIVNAVRTDGYNGISVGTENLINGMAKINKLGASKTSFFKKIRKPFEKKYVTLRK